MLDENMKIIYTTISSIEAAKKLAYSAVSEGYVNCVNIIPNITSIYNWQNNIEEANEYIMIFKTLPNHLEKLQFWLIANHPYDLPAIIIIDAKTSENFFDYLNQLVIPVKPS